ncbi:MAG: hypothetical protein V3T43_06265 [Nitrosomonadaceae bacterium]
MKKTSVLAEPIFNIYEWFAVIAMFAVPADIWQLKLVQVFLFVQVWVLSSRIKIYPQIQANVRNKIIVKSLENAILYFPEGARLELTAEHLDFGTDKEKEKIMKMHRSTDGYKKQILTKEK